MNGQILSEIFYPNEVTLEGEDTYVSKLEGYRVRLHYLAEVNRVKVAVFGSKKDGMVISGIEGYINSFYPEVKCIQKQNYVKVEVSVQYGIDNLREILNIIVEFYVGNKYSPLEENILEDDENNVFPTKIIKKSEISIDTPLFSYKSPGFGKSTFVDDYIEKQIESNEFEVIEENMPILYNSPVIIIYGICGSFLGTIPGVILYIMFTEYHRRGHIYHGPFLGILVICIGVIIGYFFGRGKEDILGKIIKGSVILIVCMLSLYLDESIKLMVDQQLKFRDSLFMTKELLSTNFEFLLHFWLCILFDCIYVIIICVFYIKTNLSKKFINKRIVRKK